MDWTEVGALATAITALIILVTGIFAILQLFEMKRTSQVSAFISVVQFLQEERVREARRLLSSLREKKFEEWTPEEIQVAELVCCRYDIVGIMVDNKLIKKKLIIQEWWRSIIVSWESAQPLISKYKNERGRDFWNNFENLYKEARKVQSGG